MGSLMSASSKSPIDVVRILTLTGAGAQILLGVFLLTQGVMALTTLGGVLVPWVSLAALAIVASGAVLVMRPGPYPLPTGRTALVIGTVAVSTALVSWNLPTHGWPGYASWHLGANTFVLLALGLRGRIGASWIGMGAMAAVSVTWTVSTGQGLVAGIDLVDRHAGTLLVGTMFALAFQRTARKISEFHETERRRATLEAETEANTQERHRQTARLESQVLPALRLINGESELSDDQRDGFRVLEASLRDEIRAGALLNEPLTSSVRRARERGVDLLLLDDSGASFFAESLLHDAVSWAAGAVDSVDQGRVVIRLRPHRHARFVSLHIEDSARSRTIEYPQ